VTEGRLRVAAITFDFGNTLVRVGREGLRAVVADTSGELEALGIVRDTDAFVRIWAEERDRQFREDVPEFREPDIPRRTVRVLARLRGAEAPPPEAHWDDAAIEHLVDPDEIAALNDVYSRAFIEHMAPVDDAPATLERLADRGFALGILSNWPLAMTIDRFAEAHGWLPFLRAIVVSERAGTIKPHPAIFRAAEAALGLEPTRDGAPAAILHVGDDWAADVVGARGAGWRAAYLRDRQQDTPLPTSERGSGGERDGGERDGGGARDQHPTADLEIDELAELDALVDLAGP
jgi:putative hydrolase of the HAD superfamily